MINQDRLRFEVYKNWVGLKNKVDEFDEDFRVDPKTRWFENENNQKIG